MDENPYKSPVDGTINDQPSLLTRFLNARFTPVELFVIAIIAILVSLLKPARSQGRRPQSKPPDVTEQR